MEKIRFNYFYSLFRNEISRILLEKEKERIGENAEELSKIFDVYSCSPIPKEEKVQIYEEALWTICSMYVSFANSKIDVFPKDAFAFCVFNSG